MITIKEHNTTPKSYCLKDVPMGELFRFRNQRGVYIKLHWNGDDFLALYKYRENGIESMLEDVQIFTEDLYEWEPNRSDRLDEDYYHENPDDFRPYYDFEDRSIKFSHECEEVELLNGELTVSLA